MPETENRIIRYRSAILLSIFITISVLLFIFLITMLRTIHSDRSTENNFITIENKAIRGKIISADDYVVAFSQKQFRAEVNTLSIDPKKKDLFINLFSIYSGLSQQEVKSKFVKNGKNIRGRIVLCKNLDVRLASDLKSLSYKMSKLGIFKPLDINKPHLVYGLDILPTSESRYFPHQDLLTPVVGYMQTKELNEGYRIPIGIKGLEKAYMAYLEPETDGVVKGKRDVLGTVVLDRKSIEVERVDGMDIHLNIPLDFQHSVEKVLDEMKEQIAAQEVMVAVMDSSTGKLLSLASSARFNPEHIRSQDVDALNPNFSEYLYEPGSVIKPLTLAIALDNNKVKMDEVIPLGGKYRVNRKYTISDDDYFKELTPKDIVAYSSNIGIAKIAWRLSGKELYDGWRNFGLGQRSGIDLSTELAGRIQPPYLLESKTYSGNSAYGYSMFVSFLQLLKAYSAFNNNGVAVTPKIVDYLSDHNNNQYDVHTEVDSLQACSAQTASIIHDVLIATVTRGTGTSAQYDGLEVGGKTGTAHIAHKGKYIEEYHSNFVGFANDKLGHKYTIGVFVIKPKKVYFGSHTAAPTFQKVVEQMVKYKYLVVDEALAKTDLAQREVVRKQKHDAYVRKIQAYNKAHGIE